MVLLSCVIVGIISVAIWTFIRYMRDDHRSKFPGPMPLPIIGNGLIFLGDTTNFLYQLGKLKDVYGDLYRVFIMNQVLFVISDVKHVEAICSSTEYISKAQEYRFLRPWLGDGLLTSTGSKWRGHRKLLTPAFHFNILQSFYKVFVKNDKILIKKLLAVADGREVDVFPIVALTALDNVAESAMGVAINAQSESESKYVQAISDISEIISTRMFNILTASDILFAFTSDCKRQGNALKILHHHTSTVIKERINALEKENIKINNIDQEFGTKNKFAFLDLLLLSEVDGKKLEFIEVREEVDTFLFEGHDTTAAGLSFTIFCLSRNPDVQEKLFEEINSIYGGDREKELTYSDLQSMKYLDLVIKESLRLYPPVPAIARMIPEDIEINNYKYLKGSTVTINCFHMMRDPKVFEDPLQFKPERFLKDDNKNHFSWIVFSAGPRNCIGQKFAMLELKVTIASIVRNFRLLPVEYELLLGADLIMRSKNGVRVKLLPRT